MATDQLVLYSKYILYMIKAIVLFLFKLHPILYHLDNILRIFRYLIVPILESFPQLNYSKLNK